MRLIITDTGFIWNQDNPFLKKYRNIVLVVCLHGRAVTNKYECFVSPYVSRATAFGTREPEHISGNAFHKGKDADTGTEKYGMADPRFQALVSVGEKLNEEMGYHDDLVFLTDNEPSTLYPYCVLKELNEYNKLHLVAMYSGNRE
ncbi:MAG: hypothetical protein HFG41_09095 [Coprococcus sp.]|nr:hypothetical protein [Coprococcus sp.]